MLHFVRVVALRVVGDTAVSFHPLIRIIKIPNSKFQIKLTLRGAANWGHLGSQFAGNVFSHSFLPSFLEKAVSSRLISFTVCLPSVSVCDKVYLQINEWHRAGTN